MFDQYAQAEAQQMEKLSETQQTLEDYRQNVIDILVRKRYPQRQIKPLDIQKNDRLAQFGSSCNYQQNNDQLNLLKNLLQQNQITCPLCGEKVNYNQFVEPIITHDLEKDSKSHILHSLCVLKI